MVTLNLRDPAFQFAAFIGVVIAKDVPQKHRPSLVLAHSIVSSIFAHQAQRGRLHRDLHVLFLHFRQFGRDQIRCVSNCAKLIPDQ